MPTVLITGASRGLGRGFAEHYRAAGWQVIATARDPDAVAPLGGEGGGDFFPLEIVPLDVADGQSVRALAARLEGRPIDLLLNNAGIYGPRDCALGAIDFDAWTEVLAVNALGPMRVAEALVDNVAASERKLMVFLSSIMGSIAQTDSGGGYIYRSSKACLNAAVKALSYDLKPRGIAAALFHPGWVRTDMGGPGAAIDVTTSVRGICNVIERLGIDDSGRFINYDGFDIPW